MALTSQVPASHSEQVEEAVLNPLTGRPRLCWFWHSPGQVQVSRLTCHPPTVPFLSLPVMRWDVAGALEPLAS